MLVSDEASEEGSSFFFPFLSSGMLIVDIHAITMPTVHSLAACVLACGPLEKYRHSAEERPSSKGPRA